MRKSDITYVVSAVFAGVFSLSYCCVMWFNIKLPRYYPLEHTWKLVKDVGVPSQGWYGMHGFALLMGGIAALVAYLAAEFVVPKSIPKILLIRCCNYFFNSSC